MKPDTTTISRDHKGRWRPGASGNRSGRPVSNPARRMLLEKAEELVQAAIDKALSGDVAALNACLSRILPQYRSQQEPICLGLPEDGTLAEHGRRIVAAVASGDYPPDVAAQLLQGIGTLARVEEISELKDRVAALEMATANGKGNGKK